MDKIFAYDNPYSRQRISAQDIKLTRRLKKKFYRTQYFDGLFQKKWKRIFTPIKTVLSHFLNQYKKYINYDRLNLACKLAISHNDPPINISSEFKLNTICVYDILPKELLLDFENGLKRFYTKYENKENIQHNCFGNFSVMKSKNQSGVYRLLDIHLGPDDSFDSYIDTICVFAEELDRAFYVITYSLILSDKATSEAREILSASLHNSPIFSMREDHLWLYEKYDFKRAHKIELENFILGIKYSFVSVIAQYIPAFFYKKGIIPPHLVVVDSLGEPQKELLDLFPFNTLRNEYEQNIYGDYDCFDGLICNLGIMIHNQSFMYDYAIVFNSVKKPSHQYFTSDIHGLHVALAKIFVGEVISEEVDKLIVESQTRINRLISKKFLSSLHMVKEKHKVYKRVYMYQRLEEALKESVEKNNYIFCNFDEFQNDYRKLLPNNFPYSNGILTHKGKLISVLQHQLDDIESLFDVFNVKLQLIESTFNNRNLRWTLIFTVISLIVSSFALLDSAEIIDIAGFFKSLFE